MAKKTNKKKSRRQFVKTTALTAAAFTIVPRYVLGGPGYRPPSDKLNVACVGAGGRGESVLAGVYNKGKENIVALCDVDSGRAANSFKTYKKAKQYVDFRKMLDKQKDIDAVIVTTPDHNHAVVAMAAMQLGKHVYVEKPLTHNIYEARKLTEAAQKYKVATQMGNQGSSGDGTRLMAEWIQAGAIGDVTKVHCWTNRPIWPQGVVTPLEKVPVPATLNWDIWQGPAKVRDYNPAYLPFKWRGWWDYGTGALGDMGCHVIEPVFKALALGYPTEVQASVSQVYSGDFVLAETPDSCPPSSKVHFKFPARNRMPEVEMVWYDGGILPDRPAELAEGEAMGDWDGGCIFEGTKGKIMCGVYGKNPTLLPSKKMVSFNQPKPVLARVPEGHQQNWVKACKEKTKTSSDFNYAGPLTETILMGNLAIRSYNYKVLKKGKTPTSWDPWDYPGRKKLLWDGKEMKITNFDVANQFVQREYRAGWSLGV